MDINYHVIIIDFSLMFIHALFDKLQFIPHSCPHFRDYLYFCFAKMSQRVRLCKKSLIPIIINNKMDDYHAETND